MDFFSFYALIIFSFFVAHLGCELVGYVLGLNYLIYHTSKSRIVLPTTIPHPVTNHRNEDMSGNEREKTYKRKAGIQMKEVVIKYWLAAIGRVGGVSFG